MKADLPAYLQSWADEIVSRASRVRNLIGDKHWLSDGTYKEFLVREFLTRHLPSYLNITRGFVRHLDSEKVSPEIDIIVSDPAKHAPLFFEADLQIVPASSVVATLEVKSTYRRAVLKDALENVVRVRAAITTAIDPVDPWSAVFIVTSGANLSVSELLDDLKELIEDHAIWRRVRTEYPTADLKAVLPSIVCIGDTAIVFLDLAEDGMINCRAFGYGTLSAAIAFAQLFLFSRDRIGGSKYLGELEGLLARLEHIELKDTLCKVPDQ